MQKNVKNICDRGNNILDEKSTNQREWEVAIENLLRSGNPFQALSLAQKAMNLFPKEDFFVHRVIRSLINTGNIVEARSILEDRYPNLLLIKDLANVDYAKFDEETVGLFGRVYKEIWKTSGNLEDTLFCRNIYYYGYLTQKSYWCAINAAMMSLASNEREEARKLAQETLTMCQQRTDTADEERFWLEATMGEANLILERYNEAILCYQRAIKHTNNRFDQAKSSLQQLFLYRDYNLVTIPKDIVNQLTAILQPPVVVIFSGHMIDAVDREEPRFPAEIEEPIKVAIKDKIKEIDAKIGYCSAANGADLLFIECMLEVGAEVNIVLPFNKKDFIRTSVAHAGKTWVERFEKALHLASSVRYVTKEDYLGSDSLFEYANNIIKGLAILRSEELLTEPKFLSVVDPLSHSLVGGAISNSRNWGKGFYTIEYIDVREIREKAIEAKDNITSTSKEKVSKMLSMEDNSSREVYAFLFADIVEYSKIGERDFPKYLAFIQEIAKNLEEHVKEEVIVNTWGDAIFIFMKSTVSMLDYALKLNSFIKEQSTTNSLKMRIALHAGPAFYAEDPFTKRANLYGTHVTMAARLEPVTLPNHVYASELFVAHLFSEQVERDQCVARIDQDYKLEFVGTKELHKNYGQQAIYHIRRKTRFERDIEHNNI
ncbi:MAG: hypothetical protein B6226_04580 [Candidatus Cloacimonetes bacterium 4572_65]|nr:MAG: hypothetical protein B6226_04580 [Candidatus Cloacimonetes bacterium 4572_65]